MLQKIYHGDSLQILKKYVQTQSVDIVVTSPPYNVAHDYDGYDDNLDFDFYLKSMKDIFIECYRVLKNDGRLCINVPFAVKNRNTKEVVFLSVYITNILNEIGFKEFELITWHKGKDVDHFQGNNTAWGSWKSPSCPSFRPLGESILVFYKDIRIHKGNAENIDISAEEFKSWTKNIWYFDSKKEQVFENVLCATNNAKKNFHPAPYPEELVERLLKIYSYQNDIVLDPFLGTGTTSFVAHKMNRQYIGIEVSKKYYSIALERMSAFHANVNGQSSNKQKHQNILSCSIGKLVNNDLSKGTLNEFFPYKEAFSPELISFLKEKFSVDSLKSIFDPFCGSGSSFLHPKTEYCYGFDTSPLACKITEVKIKKLKQIEIEKALKHVVFFSQKDVKKHNFPHWKSYQKYVRQDIFDQTMSFINYFNGFSLDLQDFIKFLVISNLESIFDYKRDGNGIKYRKAKVCDPIQYLKTLTSNALKSKIEFDKKNCKKSSIRNLSSVEYTFNKNLKVDCILTSPPYANMFDYFEIYKMELWTSRVVSNYDEWRILKKSALRNNKNANLIQDEGISNHTLDIALKKLRENNLDSSTLTMISNYFFDMKKVLKNCFQVLKDGGFCFVVVGNSCYKGIPIITDEILAQEGEKIGLKCIEIITARQTKTSSQQMKIIGKKEQKLLRESIIVFLKEKK